MPEHTVAMFAHNNSTTAKSISRSIPGAPVQPSAGCPRPFDYYTDLLLLLLMEMSRESFSSRFVFDRFGGTLLPVVVFREVARRFVGWLVVVAQSASSSSFVTTRLALRPILLRRRIRSLLKGTPSLGFRFYKTLNIKERKKKKREVFLFLCVTPSKKKKQLEHEERTFTEFRVFVDETRFHSTRGRRDETTRERTVTSFFRQDDRSIHDAKAGSPLGQNLSNSLYYFLVACVSVYIVGFLLYREHGYQKTVPAEGGLGDSKSKAAATNDTQTGEKRVYDANDLVQYSSDGVFVATRLVNTRQAKGTCLGVSGTKCARKGKNTCVQRYCSRNGRQTGRCLPSTSDPNSAHFL